MINTAQRETVSHRISRTVIRIGHGHFGDFFSAECWSPQINMYQVGDRLEICAELSGMSAAQIDVHVEPGRLVIRGRRCAPEPMHEENEPIRLLSMEIDHGTFGRVIGIPQNVDLDHVTSEYKNGLLWVRIPLLQT